jgi:beta-glucosidase
VSVTITNKSEFDGEEVVQLYIRDLFASATRPVKELKGFKKVWFKANETKTISFTINQEMLSFYRGDMTWGTEPGTHKVFVGTNSEEVLEKQFELVSH